MHPHAEIMSVDSGFDALDYGYANARAQNRTTVHGERTLWCAVIAQAFVDIGVITPQSSEKTRARLTDSQTFDDALRWLLRGKSDFTFICELAGVSPQIIRRTALIYYEQLLAHSQE